MRRGFIGQGTGKFVVGRLDRFGSAVLQTHEPTGAGAASTRKGEAVPLIFNHERLDFGKFPDLMAQWFGTDAGPFLAAAASGEIDDIRDKRWSNQATCKDTHSTQNTLAWAVTGYGAVEIKPSNFST